MASTASSPPVPMASPSPLGSGARGEAGSATILVINVAVCSAVLLWLLLGGEEARPLGTTALKWIVGGQLLWWAMLGAVAALARVAAAPRDDEAAYAARVAARRARRRWRT